MKYRLKIRAAAEADLLEAKNWYDDQRPRLGNVFLSRVRETMRCIRRNPMHYGVVYKSVRCALVTKFPYVVYFTAEADLIAVLAVLHGARDPATWRSRHD